MNKKLTYSELLDLPEWKTKRKEILTRDKWVCQKCKNDQYYETCLKGIFTGFFSNQSPGVPIFIINHEGSYFLTRKLKDDLDIRTNSVIFFRESEGKIYIYASRLLIKSEIDAYFEWIKNNLRNFVEGGGIINNGKSPFKNNDESAWTFVRDMHVHHTYYQTNLLPWEYPNSSLQTLCWSCHSDVHATTDIPVNDEAGNLVGYFDPCPRCSGAGYIPVYKHVQHGICFACGGKGYLSSDFIRKNRQHGSADTQV